MADTYVIHCFGGRLNYLLQITQEKDEEKYRRSDVEH